MNKGGGVRTGSDIWAGLVGRGQNYTIVFEDDFERSLKQGRKLVLLANECASRSILGAEARVHLAQQLNDGFNDFVMNLTILLSNPRLGSLPAVTHNGIPVGAAKHFTSNGWTATIILDVKVAVAHFIAFEPTDQTRTDLNLLTSGKAGE